MSSRYLIASVALHVTTLAFLFKDVDVICFNLQGCFCICFCLFGFFFCILAAVLCKKRKKKQKNIPQLSVLFHEDLVACCFQLGRCADHQASTTVVLNITRMLRTPCTWQLNYSCQLLFAITFSSSFLEHTLCPCKIHTAAEGRGLHVSGVGIAGVCRTREDGGALPSQPRGPTEGQAGNLLS